MEVKTERENETLIARAEGRIESPTPAISKTR